MKQEQLEQIIYKLENDPYTSIHVKGGVLNSNSTIIGNATNEMLVAEYGSATNFFNKLFESGITKVSIQERRKNGSTYKKIGEPIEMNFVKNAAQDQQAQPEPKTAPVHEAVPYYAQPNNPGLTGVEAHRFYDYERLQRENIKLEAKNEVLEQRVRDLERENLTNELLGVKKIETAKANAELMEKAAPFMPLLQSLISRNAPAAVPGLGQPLSPIKQQFVAQSDSLLEDLIPVAHGLQNDEFEAELQQLLIKYNLIQNG